MQKLELNIYDRQLKKDIKQGIPKEFLKYDDVTEWIIFLEAIFESYHQLKTIMYSKQKADRIESTKTRLKEIINSIKADPDDWIVSVENDHVSFKPLKVEKYAKKHKSSR